MLKRKYYCLVAGLPDLFFDDNKPGLGSEEFREELKQQLAPADFERIRLLYFPADNENLLNLVFQRNRPFNNGGNFSQRYLENQLEAAPCDLPAWMTAFLNWLKNTEQKEYSVAAESHLHTLFFETVLQEKNEYIANWWQFELAIKNILTTFNCRQFNYDPENQLIETSHNKAMIRLLMNNRLKPEYFEDELPFSDQIFRIAGSAMSMEEKEKAMDKLKWEYLDEFTFFHYFTIEKIVSYALKMQIIERWMKLDLETGTAFLNKLINELKTSYQFPAEFSI